MKKFLYILVVVASFIISGCGNKSESTADKLTITVSLEPQKYFLDKIVGDKINVECLLKNGANPENYEPAMNDLMTLQRSVAYVKMGNVGFEKVLVDKLSQNNKTLPVYDSSHEIDYIMGTHDCCEQHNHSHEHGEDCVEECHHSSADPHTWTSVKNAKKIARNMLNVVLKVDSANADYYNDNYGRLMVSLDSLDDYATKKLASHKGEAFLVWHPSLSYFARDYGLEQITIGQIGKELSAKQLQEQIDDARNHNARVFFFQKEFDSQQASVLNSQVGAEMITINPLSYEWEAEIRRIVDAIASK